MRWRHPPFRLSRCLFVAVLLTSVSCCTTLSMSNKQELRIIGSRYEIIKGAGRTMWCVRADEDVMRFYSKRECEAWIARAIRRDLEIAAEKIERREDRLERSSPTSLRARCAFPLPAGIALMTIYAALEAKPGRRPTPNELRAEVDRIRTEALIEVATRAGSRHTPLSQSKRTNVPMYSNDNVALIDSAVPLSSGSSWPGKSYATRSICDHDCWMRVYGCEPHRRTVTVWRSRTTSRRMTASRYEGVEQIKPWGNYSMCADYRRR